MMHNPRTSFFLCAVIGILGTLGSVFEADPTVRAIIGGSMLILLLIVVANLTLFRNA